MQENHGMIQQNSNESGGHEYSGQSNPVTQDNVRGLDSSQGDSQNSTKPERTFTQREVTDIVKRQKQEEVDKIFRLSREQPEYFSQKYGDQQSFRQPVQQQPNSSFDDSRVRELAAQEVTRLRDSWVQETRDKQDQELAQQTVLSFHQKVNEAKSNYSDFDSVTADLDLGGFPNVIQLITNHSEHTGDLLYYFGNEPAKMEIIESLSKKSPGMALKELNKIAKSISDNKAASKIRMPNEPLSQMRPSNASPGIGDGSGMTVSDYRKKYFKY